MFITAVPLLWLAPVDKEFERTGLVAVWTGVSSWVSNSELLGISNASCRFT